MSRPGNPELINEIQQIAVNEIAVKGTDGISMRQVASQAGISPTTIYYYYQDKDNLIESIKQMTIDHMDRFITSKIDPDSTNEEQAAAFCKAFVGWCIENRNLADLLFEKLPSNPEATTKTMNKYYKTFLRAVKVLKAGNESGEFKIEDEGLEATLAFAWLYGIVKLHMHNALLPQHRDNLDLLVDKIIATLIRHLKEG